MNVQSDLLVDFRDWFTQLVMKRSLMSLFLVALAAYIVSYVTKRHLEHRVSGVSTNN
jgi:hypothetical protein